MAGGFEHWETFAKRRRLSLLARLDGRATTRQILERAADLYDGVTNPTGSCNQDLGALVGAGMVRRVPNSYPARWERRS